MVYLFCAYRRIIFSSMQIVYSLSPLKYFHNRFLYLESSTIQRKCFLCLNIFEHKKNSSQSKACNTFHFNYCCVHLFAIHSSVLEVLEWNEMEQWKPGHQFIAKLNFLFDQIEYWEVAEFNQYLDMETNCRFMNAYVS